MADYLRQSAARLAAHFNRSVSHLFMALLNHKSAGSLGTLAGFAIAVAFTWKFLRFPKGKHLTQGKQSGPTTATNTSSHAHEAEDNLESGASCSNELPSQYKPNLQLSVRNKLQGSRKMTCQLLGVVFEQKTPEELQKHASVRPFAVEVLYEIAKYCDLYLMETVLDDESEARSLLALENGGLFETGGLNKNKVLFCSSDEGRISFVRQLEPDWHIDTSPEIVSQLSRFIKHQLCIGPMELTTSIPNMVASYSLEQYFMSE